MTTHHQTESVPCTICGVHTMMLGTKLCNGCWELNHRIRHQPHLARQILRDIDMEGQVETLGKESSIGSDTKANTGVSGHGTG